MPHLKDLDLLNNSLIFSQVVRLIFVASLRMQLTDPRPLMVKGDGQPPRGAMSATKLTFDGRGTNATRPGRAGPGPRLVASRRCAWVSHFAAGSAGSDPCVTEARWPPGSQERADSSWFPPSLTNQRPVF